MTYGTRHPNKEQASCRINKDGRKYVEYHTPGKKKDKGHRRDWTTSQKAEVDMGRPRQQDTR